MGRASDYYNSTNTVPAPTPVQESFNTTSGAITNQEQPTSTKYRDVGKELMQKSITDPIERDAVSRLPYEMANTIIGMPGEEEWSQKNLAQKIDYVGNGILKAGLNFIKAIPATVIKAIPKVLYTIAETMPYLPSAEKLLINEDPLKKLPTSINVPVLGEIRGFRG